MSNVIDMAERPGVFYDPRLTFSVSGRDLRFDLDIVDYLKVFYIYCPFERIESVFSHTDMFSPLYGGRSFKPDRVLNDGHLEALNRHGINLALTLTNHFFDEEAYSASLPLLEKHHQAGNSIVLTNDDLAVRLKGDFPKYELRAGIMKNIETLPAYLEALELYDSVTLPMHLNDDDEFLASLPEKKRVILFGNANCAYNCPDRTCYLGFSQKMRGMKVTSFCSRKTLPRPDKGPVYFDVKKLADMGFTRFKMVPLAPEDAEKVVRELSYRKNYYFNRIKRKKPACFIFSFPKCGRTWLRFILGQYFNLKHRLGLDLDLHNIFSLLPNHGYDWEKGINQYGFAEDERFPLILFSHERRLEPVDLASGSLLLLRGVPDVVVSDFFHQTELLKTYPGDLKSYIRDPKGGLARYVDYLNLWCDRVSRLGIQVTTYEKIHSDPLGQAEAALKCFGPAPDLELLKKAVEFASFSNMKKIEVERGLAGHPQAPKTDEARRIRKGRVGGYVDYLDQEDIVYINDYCGRALSAEAKSLLAGQGLYPENDLDHES